MQDKRIILGSSSKGRAQVLRNAGYTFEIMKPDIDEKAIGGDRSAVDANPSSIALAVAHAKADALYEKLKGKANTLLLTLDQVVAHQGTVREKPESVEVSALSHSTPSL